MNLMMSKLDGTEETENGSGGGGGRASFGIGRSLTLEKEEKASSAKHLRKN